MRILQLRSKKISATFFQNCAAGAALSGQGGTAKRLTELLWQELVNVFPIPKGRCFVVYSFPLAVCKFGRARYCRIFRGQGIDYGRCPSKKETYFGYKVHALTTLEGYITTFWVASASVDDREGCATLQEGCGMQSSLQTRATLGKLSGRKCRARAPA